MSHFTDSLQNVLKRGMGDVPMTSVSAHLAQQARAMSIDQSIAQRLRMAMSEQGIYPCATEGDPLATDRTLLPQLVTLLSEADTMALIRCAALFYAAPAGQAVKVDAWIRARAYLGTHGG